MSNARSIYQMNMQKYVPADPICVMLDTDNPLFYPNFLNMPLFQENQYFEPTGKKYMQGITDDHHITLKYGILPSVSTDDIWEVLNVWSPHKPLIPTRHIFGSYQILGNSSDYDAVVVPIELSPFISAIHSELNCFPNITTFPYYQPHITIGYFKKGFWQDLDPRLLPPLKHEIGPLNFRITGGNDE